MPLGYGHYAIYQGNATYFTHPNALGSTTMVTDYDGNVVQDKLFYPWGQDWQTIGTVYDERFAKLQRRDTETSLDPTPNRMFASLEGRWLTPDPGGKNSADATNPQSWNRYGYALNNPATVTDPTGLIAIDPTDPYCFGEDSAGFPVDLCSIESWFLPIIPPLSGGGSGSTGGRPTPPAGGMPPGFVSAADPTVDLTALGILFRVTTVCAEVPGCLEVWAAAPEAGAVVVAGVLIYKGIEVAIQIYQSKGGKQNVSSDEIRKEARQLAMELHITYCQALQAIYQAARATGNFSKANATKATQKQDGCRGH